MHSSLCTQQKSSYPEAGWVIVHYIRIYGSKPPIEGKGEALRPMMVYVTWISGPRVYGVLDLYPRQFYVFPEGV